MNTNHPDYERAKELARKIAQFPTFSTGEWKELNEYQRTILEEYSKLTLKLFSLQNSKLQSK